MNETKHEWHPEYYARNSSPQYLYAMETIPKLNLKGSEAILDIGCGDGRITHKLKSLLPDGEVVGIDNSEEMIKFSKETFQNSDSPGLSFYTMDATQISLPMKFDIAFSNAALHWVKDQLSVLKSVKNCLKKEGRIFFQMTGKGSMQKLFEAFLKLLANNKWPSYFTEIQFSGGLYSEEQYTNWLTQAELTPIRVELVKRINKFSTISDFEGYLLSAYHPITERVPETERDVFVSELVDEYLKIVPLNEEGFPFIEVIRLEVEAVNTFA